MAFLSAAKIAARLVMVGFPAGESMRCTLFEGFSTDCASCSKPIVAFTRSRRMSLAVSGSPFRNSVAASSSRALAKSGSCLTRATTVALKSRVNAIASLLASLSSVFKHLSLAALVVFPKLNRPVDIFLLSLFAAATQQDDDLNSVSGQIDAPAGAKVDLVFTDAAKPSTLDRLPCCMRNWAVAILAAASADRSLNQSA